MLSKALGYGDPLPTPTLFGSVVDSLMCTPNQPMRIIANIQKTFAIFIKFSY